MTTKQRGGGVKALVVGPLKKERALGILRRDEALEIMSEMWEEKVKLVSRVKRVTM